MPARPSLAKRPTAKRRPLRVAVLASGRGSNLVALARACQAGLVRARIVLVVSDVADAPCLAAARRAGVPAILALPPEPREKADAYDRRLAGALTAERPDIVVLAGYMRILGGGVVGSFPGRIVNIHPSLLPAFKGLKAIRQALAAGAAFAGCTTHIVTGDLDGGPILLQAALPVRPDEAEAALVRRVLRLEHLLLPRTVQLFAEGRVRVEAGRARIAPGASWLGDPRVELVAGALYGEGF